MALYEFLTNLRFECHTLLILDNIPEIKDAVKEKIQSGHFLTIDILNPDPVTKVFNLMFFDSDTNELGSLEVSEDNMVWN